MKKFWETLAVRLRYRFDNTLGSGTTALIFWLGIITLLIVATAATIVTILNIDPEEKNINFYEAFWISLMRTLDPGNLSNDNGWSFRGVMLLMTVVGILLVSTLIGIINSGIEVMLENLRKGRSFVDERDHILILGWSPMIFSLLNRLVVGNNNKKKIVIVVLAEKDKIEMEDEIKMKVFPSDRVKIIFRNGSPLDRTHIEIVNPHQARTIVVLSPEEDIHDIHSVKTVMALMKSHNRKQEMYHIIAEVKDRDNEDVLKMIAKDEITLIVSEELFSRITVQASIQSGLSEVYNELLDFNDIEIQFNKFPELKGLSFQDASMRFCSGQLIGLRTENGIFINPDKKIPLSETDALILIVRRERGILLKDSFSFNKELFSQYSPGCKAPHKTLLLGWNSKGRRIISELDQYFVKGSEVTIVADAARLDRDIEELTPSVKKQKISVKKGIIRDKKFLQEVLSQNYDHVILLSYSDDLDVQSADALTLITLINLRKISEELNKKITVVSEILDIRNRSLAESTHADDFIVSDRLISMVMAQLACNIELKKVFDEILSPEGSEIYLRPVKDYIAVGVPVDFYSVCMSAFEKNHTAIGYRLSSIAEDPDNQYGIVLSPDKSEKIVFNEKDKIIVLAEE